MKLFKFKIIHSIALPLALICTTAFTPIAQAQTSAKSNDKEDIAPEISTGLAHRSVVKAKEFMAVAANPVAAQVGARILANGGNAIDAAIATQMILNIVEPQSSGIGGGAFMLYWDNKAKKLYSYDGRETAPKNLDKGLFYRVDGTPKAFKEAVVSGKSVGVPGVLSMLYMAHKAHGKKPWKELFQPAIELAANGFPVSPRLHKQLSEDKDLRNQPVAYAYFYDKDGKAWKTGTLLKNPALAKTFTTIANQGIEPFYKGQIAKDIVKALQNAKDKGYMTLEDLAGYNAKTRIPVCSQYHQYKVCSMPPPSSGGSTILSMLGILENFNLKGVGPDSLKFVKMFTEAERLAFADRNMYIADPDFVKIPLKQMLDKKYLQGRSKLMQLNEGTKVKQQPGIFNEKTGMKSDTSPTLPCTTHMVFIDKEGNAVSMTTTIENGFGSRQMVDGFLLNNQLTDFSRDLEIDGVPVRNHFAPNKRPRSSMAPTLVFGPDKKLFMAIGSPGGSRIIGYTAQALLNVLDLGMDIQSAVSAPHFGSRNGPLDLEKGTDVAKLAPALEALGYKVKVRPMNSGLHGFVIKDGIIQGGADPRREGAAVGDENLKANPWLAFGDLGLPIPAFKLTPAKPIKAKPVEVKPIQKEAPKKTGTGG